MGNPAAEYQGDAAGLSVVRRFAEYVSTVDRARKLRSVAMGESDRSDGLGSGLQGGTSTAILEVDGVEVIAIGGDLRVVDLIGTSFAKVKRDGGGRWGCV